MGAIKIWTPAWSRLRSPVTRYPPGQSDVSKLNHLDGICNKRLVFLSIAPCKRQDEGIRLATTDIAEDDIFDPTKVEPLGLKAFEEPDPKAVMSECERITDLAFEPEAMGFQWRSMRIGVMSVVVRLEDGRDRMHSLLKNKIDYNEARVDGEIELALTASGPRFCKNLNSLTKEEKCKSCKYWEHPRITSPIKIQGESYIKTIGTGFWNVKMDKHGNPTPTSPNYDDLYKYFQQSHEHITMADSGVAMIYKDRHWQIMEPLHVKAFTEEKMKPKPKNTHRTEFLAKVQCNNLRDPDWLTSSTEGLINLQNGVFDVKEDCLKEHSTDYGFRYILPYEYTEGAQCPRFLKFLDEVTLGRTDIQTVLMEFVGYALANGPCFAEKALILYGSGANGKSTFMDVLKALAGTDNYSSLSLTALNKDSKRYLVDGKLFNIGEETSVKALGESEVFKTMVTGGEIDVKKLYTQDYIIKNRCKLIMACNELPKSSDRSDGLYRRMIMVPFEAKFTKGNKDPEIREKLFKELPGIFNLALEGYKRLRKQNWQMSDSDSLDSAIESYKIENDNVLQWKLERLYWTGEDENFVFKDVIYKDYVDFCQEQGQYNISKIGFFKALKDRLPEYRESKRTAHGFVSKRVLMGVKMGEFGDS